MEILLRQKSEHIAMSVRSGKVEGGQTGIIPCVHVGAELIHQHTGRLTVALSRGHMQRRLALVIGNADGLHIRC